MSTTMNILNHYFTSEGPGAAVAIIDPGYEPVIECFGMADIDRGIPIDAQTLFDLASVGKLITATLVLKLIENQRLSMDMPVAELLEEMSNQKSGRAVTIRDLLWHTSGLPDYLAEGKYTETDAVSLQSVLDRLGTWSMTAQPGLEFMYSNTNYLLLAEICSRVCGEPFESCLSTQLLEPFALEGMHTVTQDIQDLPAASGYVYCGSGLPTVEQTGWMIETLGDGGIYSSAESLARFMTLLFSDQIVSESTRRLMCTRGQTDDGTPFDYGCGIQLEGGDAASWYGHGGSWVGTTTLAGCYSPENRIVIILSNEEMAPVERLSWQLMRHA